MKASQSQNLLFRSNLNTPSQIHRNSSPLNLRQIKIEKNESLPEIPRIVIPNSIGMTTKTIKFDKFKVKTKFFEKRERSASPFGLKIEENRQKTMENEILQKYRKIRVDCQESQIKLQHFSKEIFDLIQNGAENHEIVEISLKIIEEILKFLGNLINFIFNFK